MGNSKLGTALIAIVSSLVLLTTWHQGWAATSGDRSCLGAHWDRTTFHVGIPGQTGPILTIEVASHSILRVSIVGPDGRKVRTLTDGIRWGAGTHRLTWDGRDDSGRLVPNESYVPLIERRDGPGWVIEFNPNAEATGKPVSPETIEWNRTAGRIVLNVPEPMRLRAWIIGGDDGCILHIIKDMEPVDQGLLILSYRGIPLSAQPSLAHIGKQGGHFRGFALPSCSLIVQGNGQRQYLAERSDYQEIAAAKPIPTSESSALYRYPYLMQKAIRFKADVRANELWVSLLPPFDTLLSGQALHARVFSEMGWTELPLLQDAQAKEKWHGPLAKTASDLGPVISVVVGTSEDQFGFYTLSSNGNEGESR